MKLDIDISQLEELSDALQENIYRKGLDNSLDVLGSLLLSGTEKRLDEGGTAPDGSPWQEWSSSYAKTRHANHSLLKSEGELHDDLNYLVGKDYIFLGSNLDYARIHNEGGKAGRNKKVLIPARQYIGISKFDEKNIIATLQVGFSKSLEEHLGK